MTLRNFTGPVLFCVALAPRLFAAAGTTPENGVSYSLTTNAAYYLGAESEAGDDHFTGVSGPFGGIKAVSTLNASYALPRHSEINGGIEISPLTVRALLSAQITPLPFLVFGAGSAIGTGWNALGFEGMSLYRASRQEYEDLVPFTHYHTENWMKGAFQFDTGALFPGDWNHIVFSATYMILYKWLTGTERGDIWLWQESAGEANGWQYYAVGVLGYQMPTILRLVGAMAEFYGHYDDADYGKLAKTFDGDFMTVTLNAFANFQLNKANSLLVLVTFEGRRSFSSDYEEEGEIPQLVTVGREWYFNRFGFSWRHSF